jgi:hypothetical protein
LPSNKLAPLGRAELCGGCEAWWQQVLRGFEPRSLDSESRALTVTPQDQLHHCGQRGNGWNRVCAFAGAVAFVESNDPGRTRACNPRLRGPMPYPLGHGAS